MINVEDIAKTCHELNKALCESHGDTSQVAWEDAPKEIRESAITGVKFHLMNPNATPEDSHQSWMMVKQAQGYVYGEEKDLVKKTHPCFRPYDELPEIQKAKDYVFRQTVHSLARLDYSPTFKPGMT